MIRQVCKFFFETSETINLGKEKLLRCPLNTQKLVTYATLFMEDKNSPVMAADRAVATTLSKHSE